MEGARAKILDVATRLFAEKGFAGVSIRELTEAAKVNVSAISYYFGGKEGLYKEVIKDQLSWTMKVLDIVKKKVEIPPIERLRLYMQMQSDVGKKRPLLGKFVSSEMSNPTNIAGAVIIEHITIINKFTYDLIKEGIEKGDFRSELDPAYCAMSLAGILNFYFHAQQFAEKLAKYENYEGMECISSRLNGKEYINHAIDEYFYGIAKANSI